MSSDGDPTLTIPMGDGTPQLGGRSTGIGARAHLYGANRGGSFGGTYDDMFGNGGTPNNNSTGGGNTDQRQAFSTHPHPMAATALGTEPSSSCFCQFLKRVRTAVFYPFIVLTSLLSMALVATFCIFPTLLVTSVVICVYYCTMDDPIPLSVLLRYMFFSDPDDNIDFQNSGTQMGQQRPVVQSKLIIRKVLAVDDLDDDDKDDGLRKEYARKHAGQIQFYTESKCITFSEILEMEEDPAAPAADAGAGNLPLGGTDAPYGSGTAPSHPLYLTPHEITPQMRGIASPSPFDLYSSHGWPPREEGTGTATAAAIAVTRLPSASSSDSSSHEEPTDTAVGVTTSAAATTNNDDASNGIATTAMTATPAAAAMLSAEEDEPVTQARSSSREAPTESLPTDDDDGSTSESPDSSVAERLNGTTTNAHDNSSSRSQAKELQQLASDSAGMNETAGRVPPAPSSGSSGGSGWSAPSLTSSAMAENTENKRRGSDVMLTGAIAISYAQMQASQSEFDVGDPCAENEVKSNEALQCIDVNERGIAETSMGAFMPNDPQRSPKEESDLDGPTNATANLNASAQAAVAMDGDLKPAAIAVVRPPSPWTRAQSDDASQAANSERLGLDLHADASSRGEPNAVVDVQSIGDGVAAATTHQNDTPGTANGNSHVDDHGSGDDEQAAFGVVGTNSAKIEKKSDRNNRHFEQEMAHAGGPPISASVPSATVASAIAVTATVEPTIGSDNTGADESDGLAEKKHHAAVKTKAADGRRAKDGDSNNSNNDIPQHDIPSSPASVHEEKEESDGADHEGSVRDQQKRALDHPLANRSDADDASGADAGVDVEASNAAPNNNAEGDDNGEGEGDGWKADYFGVEDSRDRGTACDICLLSFEVDDLVAWSPNKACSHTYHKDCILDWLIRKPTCPNCRQNYLKDK